MDIVSKRVSHNSGTILRSHKRWLLLPALWQKEAPDMCPGLPRMFDLYSDYRR